MHFCFEHCIYRNLSDFLISSSFRMSIVNDSDEITSKYIKWFVGIVVHSWSGELAVMPSRDY